MNSERGLSDHFWSAPVGVSPVVGVGGIGDGDVLRGEEQGVERGFGG